MRVQRQNGLWMFIEEDKCKVDRSEVIERIVNGKMMWKFTSVWNEESSSAWKKMKRRKWNMKISKENTKIKHQKCWGLK